jgi:hypothetical protein
MIHLAIRFLAAQINLALRRDSDQVYPVTCCAVADDAGKWAIPENSVGLSVINVEEERTTREQEMERRAVVSSQNDTQNAAPRIDLFQPAIKLNLQVLFAARSRSQLMDDPEAKSREYLKQLQSLSSVIAILQAIPRYSSTQFPELADYQIERMSLEMLTLSSEQMNQIWSSIGTRYLPSAVYRLRLIRIPSSLPSRSQPLITATSISAVGAP